MDFRGQFTLAGSPKAQLIMHCLQHELWQNASNNTLGEISKQQETCGAIFFGCVLRYGPSGYHR